MKTFVSRSTILALLLTLVAGFGLQSVVYAAPETGQPKAEQFAGKVNINSASVEEIADRLIGIGPKKAEALVAYREKIGAFTSLEQLLEVKGIGEATLEKNAARIAL